MATKWLWNGIEMTMKWQQNGNQNEMEIECHPHRIGNGITMEWK